MEVNTRLVPARCSGKSEMIVLVLFSYGNFQELPIRAGMTARYIGTIYWRPRDLNTLRDIQRNTHFSLSPLDGVMPI